MIKQNISDRYKVDPYGTEEIISSAANSCAPILTIDYGDEVQTDVMFTIRPTKGNFDTSIRNMAIVEFIKGNTVKLTELRSVKMLGIKSVGFNQWDEQWELGRINNDTGQDDNTSRVNVRSKNYIPILPNTKYCYTAPYKANRYYYDAEKNFISFENIGAVDMPVTTPPNAAYMRFFVATSYGSVYNNDICFNLHHSGDRDGEYESYWKSILNISVTTLKGKLNGQGSSAIVFPDGMNKVDSTYDEIRIENNKAKAIKRIGSRAYQSGDEADSTVLTDGSTITFYVLSIPEEYTLDALDVQKIMFGANEATKVYLGNQLIFEESD